MHITVMLYFDYKITYNIFMTNKVKFLTTSKPYFNAKGEITYKNLHFVLYGDPDEPIFNIDYVIRYAPNIDPNNVINRIMSGVDILLVDPQIYPTLVSPLYVFRDIYTEQHEPDLVKKCNFLLDYIAEYPRRVEIARTLMNKPPEPEPKPPALEPEEVNKIVDDLIQTDDIKYYPREELELILAELRKRRAEYQSKGEYINAQKADQYAKAIMTFGQLGAVEQLQNNKVEEIRAKLQEAQQQLENNKQKWEQLYNNLRNQAKEDLTQINTKFEDEIDVISKEFDSELPANFKKPSNQLLQLRRRQKALVESKRYDEAATTKENADKLEEQEKKKNMETWHKSIQKKIDAKKKDQVKTLTARKQFWKREEEALVNEANVDVEKAQQAIEHIKINLKQAEKAQNLANKLKENSKENIKNNGTKLPPLQVKTRMQDAAAYRQRAILNAQIYTRPAVVQPPSPTGKNKN